MVAEGLFPFPAFFCTCDEPTCDEVDEKETDMWWIGGIIGLTIWILIAFWPARVASRRGHSWLGYFILSIFFFPLALVMAYVVQDRRVPGY